MYLEVLLPGADCLTNSRYMSNHMRFSGYLRRHAVAPAEILIKPGIGITLAAEY